MSDEKGLDIDSIKGQFNEAVQKVLSKWDDFPELEGKGVREDYLDSALISEKIIGRRSMFFLDHVEGVDNGYILREAFEGSLDVTMQKLDALTALLSDDRFEESLTQALDGDAYHAKRTLSSTQVMCKLRTVAILQDLASSQGDDEKTGILATLQQKLFVAVQKDYASNVKETVDRITNTEVDPDKEKLTAMWNSLDAGSEGKVSEDDVIAWCRLEQQLWLQPGAVPAAVTHVLNLGPAVLDQSEEDTGLVARVQFPSLLAQLAIYNQMFFLLWDADTDNSRSFEPEQINALITKLEISEKVNFDKMNKSNEGTSFVDVASWIGKVVMKDKRLVTLADSNAGEDEFSALYAKVDQLVEVVKSGDYHAVSSLIQQQPIQERVAFVNQIDRNGDSVIFHSLEPSRYDIMELLLDYGADATYHNSTNRNTPLHIAATKNYKKTVPILLQLGGDMNSSNAGFQKPADLAGENKDAWLALLSTTTESNKADFKEKRLLQCSRQQRSFIRSMFDIIDYQRLGKIRVKDIAPMLSIMYRGVEVGPNPEHLMKFFASFDTEYVGTISFSKFLHGMIQYLNSKEPKKGKKKKSKKKRKNAY